MIHRRRETLTRPGRIKMGPTGIPRMGGLDQRGLASIRCVDEQVVVGDGPELMGFSL